MLVCSMDGTVAYLDFSLDELGDPLSEEEKVRPSSDVEKYQLFSWESTQISFCDNKWKIKVLLTSLFSPFL